MFQSKINIIHLKTHVHQVYLQVENLIIIVLILGDLHQYLSV